MKRVSLDALRPGMRLAMQVLDKQGNLVYRAGDAVVDASRQLLAQMDYHWVTVLGNREFVLSGQMEIDSDSPSGRMEQGRTILACIDSVLGKRTGKPVPVGTLLETLMQKHGVAQRLLEVGVSEAYLGNLTHVWRMLNDTGICCSLEEQDHGYLPAIAAHMGKTGAYVFLLCKWMGLRDYHTERILRTWLLALSGYLYIGPGYFLLSEAAGENPRRFVQQVPIISSAIASQSPSLQSLIIPQVLLHFRERDNGSGTPKGLFGAPFDRRLITGRAIAGRIHPGAQILAVAETFVCLTSHRPDTRKLTREEALLVMRLLGDGALSNEVMRHFLRYLPPWEEGSRVLVIKGPYAGYTATVTRVHASHPTRPVIRITEDADKQTLRHPIEADLRHTEWCIRSVDATNDIQTSELRAMLRF